MKEGECEYMGLCSLYGPNVKWEFEALTDQFKDRVCRGKLNDHCEMKEYYKGERETKRLMGILTKR